MIIAVHEVEVHILVNSGRSHATSVLGVADCAPSGHLLLGSGAWCGENNGWIHGPGECVCRPLGAVGIADGRGQGETTRIEFWFCGFDARETEDGFATRSESCTIAQLWSGGGCTVGRVNGMENLAIAQFSRIFA